jgi:hypothetical protein
MFLGQFVKRSGNFGEMLNVAPIILSEAGKTANFFDILRSRPVTYSFDFLGISADALSGDNVSQELNRGLH